MFTEATFNSYDIPTERILSLTFFYSYDVPTEHEVLGIMPVKNVEDHAHFVADLVTYVL